MSSFRDRCVEIDEVMTVEEEKIYSKTGSRSMNNSKSIFSVFKILLITVIRRLVDDLLAFQADFQFDEIFFPHKSFLIAQQCDYCTPDSHPVEYAIDGSEKWWQSPPLSRGMKFNEVNLTIDFGQVSVNVS